MKKNQPEASFEENDEPLIISRRNLLKTAGCLSATVLSAGAASVSVAATDSSQTAAASRIPVREAFETLTAAESETLESLVSRILPSDEYGPGAHEARAAHFIDKTLAGPQSKMRENYAAGLESLENYSQASKGKAFHVLSVDEQNEIIGLLADNRIEGFAGLNIAFFNIVRTHTIEGTFSDPYYGGNRDFIGWNLLGYPGVRMGSTPEDTIMGNALEPSLQSAYDMGPYSKNAVKPYTQNNNGQGGVANGN